MDPILLSLIIATAPSQLQPAAARWHLSEQPIQKIGEVEGDSDKVLGTVAGAVRLQSGVLVVADGVNLNVRFYSPSGNLLRTAGRRGDGPGEFRTILSIRRCHGDQVYVYDPPPALAAATAMPPRSRFSRCPTVPASGLFASIVRANA